MESAAEIGGGVKIGIARDDEPEWGRKRGGASEGRHNCYFGHGDANRRTGTLG